MINLCITWCYKKCLSEQCVSFTVRFNFLLPETQNLHSEKILTPEMLEELESRPKHYLHDLVSSYHKKVLVFYDSRDFQICGVCRTLDYHCPEILKWKKFKTGNNDTNFWQMCFEMFNMTNMKDQSFKLMPKRIWMVSSCTFRNKIYL